MCSIINPSFPPGKDFEYDVSFRYWISKYSLNKEGCFIFNISPLFNVKENSSPVSFTIFV
jgi:hypothetical protein